MVIRDDDTSFFTSPGELEKVYGRLWKAGGRVSLAVVPYAFKEVCPGKGGEMYIDTSKQGYIYDNQELVGFLRDLISRGQVEVLLHGYDHSYAYKTCSGEYRILDEAYRNAHKGEHIQIYPECNYKAEDLLTRQIAEGKKILEDTFGVKVKVFVPPAEGADQSGVRAIRKAGLSISGTQIDKHFNREVSLRSLYGYARVALWKLTNDKGKIKYPFTIDYGNIKEMASTELSSYDVNEFQRVVDTVRSHRAPLVVSTHYWDLLENPDLLEMLYALPEIKETSTLEQIMDIR